MELESELPRTLLGDLGTINSKDLSFICQRLINELIKRYDSNNNEKPFLRSSLMNMKSILFTFELDLLGKPNDLSKYTPFRSNQLELSILNKEKCEYLTPKKEYIEEFLIKYWNECYCSRKCFSRVKLSNALEIHQKYADMFLEEKNSSIGALLLNMTDETKVKNNNIVGLLEELRSAKTSSYSCIRFLKNKSKDFKNALIMKIVLRTKKKGITS